MDDKLKNYKEKYGLEDRITEILYPPKLTYCDTGELLKLLSTLGNLECTKLHIKINEYFWRTIKAVSFIIERIELPPCMKVRAIGDVPLKTPLELKQDCLFLQKPNATKEVERISRNDIEGSLVCEIERVLQEEYVEEFGNCFLFPIEHPNQRMHIPYFVGLVNAKDFFECEKVYHGIISECMRHCFGMIKNASKFEEEKMHHEKIKTLLTAYVQIISSMGSDMMFHEIQSQCAEALGGSNCSVFLENIHNELMLETTDAKYQTPEDEVNLLTHHVFNTGLPFNCKVAAEEPLYNNCSDNIPRNLIAFPIRVESKNCGVVEVYDKKNISSTFDNQDLELCLPLSQIVGLAIDTHSKFESFITHKLKLAYSDCIFLRRTRLIDDYNAVLMALNCKENHKYYRYGDIRFETTTVPEAHVICFCLQIFERLGLLRLYEVNREKFVRFLLKVKHAYSALPFHGWSKGFSTFHFTFTCINNLNLIQNKYISAMEAFAMLVAALCHSLDSRGSTNMFQMTSGTVLASLYSSPGSIAQKHHASQTLRLMNFPECNFLENMSDEKFLTFAVLLIHMIRDTDISYNKENLKAISELVCNEYDFQNLKHRRYIHNLILNCAQMSSICKDWICCRKNGERGFQEFYRKGDLSHANAVFEMSELNEDILKLPEMNTNFIENIFLPTFSVFMNVFPRASMYLKGIDQNLSMWRAEKEKILATMVQDALGDTGGEEED